jgi:polysaccharide pyruvyl transferase WcaK-like protein
LNQVIGVERSRMYPRANNYAPIEVGACEMEKTAERQEVLIVGHYGGSNAGDEAMLMSLLVMLPPWMNISIVTKDTTLGRHATQGVGTVGLQTKAVLRALAAADMVLLGGGTHFHDDYRGGRLLRHYIYMTRYLAVFAIAKLLRKRVYCIGMGFGPFKYRLTKLISRCTLALADGVSVRDQASFDEAVCLGAGSKTVRAFDLAALLTPSASQVTSPDRLYLAVSVTDIPGIEGSIVSRERVLGMMAESLGTLLRLRPEVHVKVIVVRGGTRESDLEVSQRLVDALSAYSERVKLVPYMPDPMAVLDEFRTSLAACVMRYHAGMFAYLAGCRLLLLPYHRKLVDLGHEIGLPSLACPALAQLNGNRLASQLSKLMSSESSNFTPTLPVSTARIMALRNVTFWN